MMKSYKYIMVGLSWLLSLTLQAQEHFPQINPQASYTDADGVTQTTNVISGNAPLEVRFAANPSGETGWEAHYEWRFYKTNRASEPYMIRYEEQTSFVFLQAGTHFVECYATFVQGKDTVSFTKDFWAEAEPMIITISESKLEMPNAFSPNGDGINDIYRPKRGWQSLVEFHAYIFNRWGEKLYEWSNPDEGWDGKYKGHDVAQGVYYCLVKAKGADGKVYNIKTDVNLLRGYAERNGVVE